MKNVLFFALLITQLPAEVPSATPVGPGTGVPRWVAVAQTEVSWKDVRLRDMDGDGRADVVRLRDRQLEWFRNGGKGWQRLTQVSDKVDMRRVLLADVNGDGSCDYGMLRGDRLHWRSLRGGDWQKNDNFPHDLLHLRVVDSPGSPALYFRIEKDWLRMGKVAGSDQEWNPSIGGFKNLRFGAFYDDRVDLLFITGNNHYAVLQNARGPARVLGPAYWPMGKFLVGDVDGDGLSDIVGEIEEAGLQVLHVSSGGRREPRPLGHVSLPLERLALADMNGDGVDDIVGIQEGAVAYVPMRLHRYAPHY